MSDVVIMIALGAIGWVLDRYGFKPSPIVLGLILSSIAEQGFVQGWIIGGAKGNIAAEFFVRPIAMGIIAFIGVSMFYPVIARRWRLNEEPQNARET
jgi:putative tricarboxylic transport membrane protein